MCGYCKEKSDVEDREKNTKWLKSPESIFVQLKDCKWEKW